MQWQPMETALKDGTVLRVTNDAMGDNWVEARYGDYTSRFGTTSQQWVLVRDPAQFMPALPGTLVVPSKWASA